MPKPSKLLLPVLLAALFASAGAAPAGASHGQVVYFEASTVLLNSSTRAKAFEQMRHLGVRALRVELFWSRVAPGANNAAKPSFNATEPASYNWSEYDPVLEEAKKLGWQ
ncbi:MAG TPA: hypothetical protein VMB91_09450, partial [Solirubrobacteraceae bacterium]|nr:hypothetical protein [Solirubrobacteraceae bacterium]